MSSLISFDDYLKLCNQVKKITLFSGLDTNINDIQTTSSDISNQHVNDDTIHNTNIFKYVQYESVTQLKKYESIVSPLNNFHFASIQTSAPRNITIAWFHENELSKQNFDLLEEYIVPVVTQKISETFEKIRNYIDVEKAKVAELNNTDSENILKIDNVTKLSTEFETFCSHFSKHIQSLFPELSQNGKTLSLDGSTNIFQLFDWMLLYSACYRSTTLFNIIYETTEFPSLLENDINQFSNILNRFVSSNKWTTILTVVLQSNDFAKYFVEKFGILKVWKFLLYNKDPVSNPLPLLTTNFCEKLFNLNMIPEQSHPDYEEICTLINTYQDDDKKNLFHYIVAYSNTNCNVQEDSIKLKLQHFSKCVSKLEPFSGLKYQENKFGLIPITHIISRWELPPLTNNTNIALQIATNINNSDFFHDATRKEIENYLQQLQESNFFTLDDFCVVVNNISMISFHQSFTSIISSITATKYFIIEKIETIINAMLYNFCCDYFTNLLKTIIFATKDMLDHEIIQLLTKQIKLYEYDCEYPLFAILGSFHVIEEILLDQSDEAVQVNLSDNQEHKFYNTIVSLLKQHPFLFNFGTKHKNHTFFNLSNKKSIKMEAEYCPNIVKLLSSDKNNFKWILLYLDSVYTPPDITNMEFFTQMYPHVINIKMYLENVDNILPENFSVIIKYLTAMLPILGPQYVQQYMEYVGDLSDIHKYTKSLKCVIELMHKYENSEKYTFLPISMVLHKYEEYDTNNFTKIITQDNQWYMWKNNFHGTCGVFAQFEFLTERILSNKSENFTSDITFELQTDTLVNDLKLLTLQMPEVYNLLLKKTNIFNDVYKNNTEIIDTSVKTYEIDTLFAIMCLPDYDFNKIVEEFKLCIINNTENYTVMPFMSWIASGFKTTTDGKIFIHESIPFIKFSQLFIENIIKKCDTLINKTSNCEHIFGQMIQNELISKHNCGEKYIECLLKFKTYFDEKFQQLLNDHITIAKNTKSSDKLIKFLDMGNKSFNLITSIFSYPQIVSELLEINEFAILMVDILPQLNLEEIKDKTSLNHIIEKKLLDIKTIYNFFFLKRNHSCVDLFEKIINVYGFKELCTINFEHVIMSKVNLLLQSPLFNPTLENLKLFVFVINILSKSHDVSADFEHQLLSEMLVFVSGKKLVSIELFRIILQKKMVQMITEEFINLFLEKASENASVKEELISHIAPVIYKYVNLCKEINCQIVCENKLISLYPSIVLVSEDFEEKIKTFEPARLLTILSIAEKINNSSPKITSHQQDLILNNIVQSENNEYLEKMLACIPIFSSFVSNNFEMITRLAINNPNIFQNLIGFEECPIDLLFAENLNGDFLLMSIPTSRVCLKTSKRFIQQMSTKQILSTNKRGNLKILHFLYNPYITHILNRSDVGMLFSDKKIGPIVFSFLMDSVIEKSLADILAMFPETIRKSNEYTNIDGNNFYMALLEASCNDSVGYELTDVINMIETELSLDSNILLHKNNDGNTLLFLGLKHTNVFNQIINLYMKTLGKESLMEANNDSETLLMYAIRHNPDILSTLLKNPNICVDQNYVYANTGSILTYTIVYTKSIDIFDMIMKWNFLSPNYFDMTQQIKIFNWETKKHEKVCMSVSALACVYSPEIFRRFLLASATNIDNIQTQIGKKIYNLIELSYLYEPESFQHIFGSNKLSQSFPTKEQCVFFLDYAETQPASWYHFVRSKYYKSTIYKQQQFNKIYYTLRPDQITASSIARYIQTKNEVASTLEERCEICVQNRKKIMYGCMQHFACVSCCLKSEVCPYCRHTGNRIKVFD